jgi:hypothetical protein
MFGPYFSVSSLIIKQFGQLSRPSGRNPHELALGLKLGISDPRSPRGPTTEATGDIAEPPRNCPRLSGTLSILQTGTAEEFAEPRVGT